MKRTLIFLGFLLLFIGCTGVQEPNEIQYVTYTDFLGNYSLEYPSHWNYDDVGVFITEGYNVVFESKAADARLGVFAEEISGEFEFQAYAKNEFQTSDPSIHDARYSEIHFKGFPAYESSYTYGSLGKQYFGGGLLIKTPDGVLGISYTAPQEHKEIYQKIFDHMLNSIEIHSS